MTRGPLVRAVVLRYACGATDIVLSAHHLVVDERSVELLAGWVLAESPSPPARSFGDWVDQAWAAADRATGGRSDELAAADLDADLSWGLGDPTADVSHGARVPVLVPDDVWRMARAQARQLGVTPTSMLTAAAGLVFGRNARSRHPVVATTVSRRPISQLNTLGYFNSMVLTPLDLVEELPVDEYVQGVHRRLLHAYAHADVPFTTVVDGGPDLIPSLVVVPCAQLPTVELADATAIPHPDPDLATAQFPLTLYTYDRGDGPLTGLLQYQRRWFAPAAVEVFARQLLIALAGLANSAARLVDVATLHPDDAAVAAREAVGPDLAEPTDSIHDRIGEYTRAQPDAVAVVAEDGRLTYAELDRRSASLARVLGERGVKDGDRVGVSLPRGAGLVVALLAVLRAGAAYVPLDPDYPADRLALMIVDAAPAAFICGDLTTVPVPAEVEVVTPDMRPADDREALPDVPPTNAAYVIYTSGSTGQPKGVVVEHRNVLSLMDAIRGPFGLGPDDVWSLFHSFAFDFSVWELWGALTTGGRVIVVPFWTSRDPYDFHTLLADKGITVLSQTPSAFAQLVTEDRSSSRDLRVRLVVFGGETLDPHLLLPWFDRHPDSLVRAVNMYGITETTVHCTWRTLDRADALRGSRSVGRPLPGWRLYILDEQGRQVPPGVPGEIYVGGRGVARGYLGRPELTAQRFVHHPALGERLYRSGDVGRRLPGGEIEHLGRADDQMKIRGHRIEPGEVRAAMQRVGGVRAASAVAVVPEGDRAAARLEAYVVLDPPGSVAAVYQRLRETLPAYLVPAAITAVPELPLTVNGKLDLARLRTAGPSGPPASVESDVERAGQAGEGGAVDEAVMADVWSRILGAQVGLDDSFFQHGGTSLLAVRLHHALRDLGCAGIRLVDIFRHPTPRRLCAVLNAGRPSA